MMSMVQSAALSKFRWVLLQTTALLLVATRPVVSQTTTAVQQLISELPPCSLLRAELERGSHGDGVDRPYMERMRQRGVQRALLEVKGTWNGRDVENARVVRRLYFRRFDGPDSQISDETTLKAIKETGLLQTLDDLALSRASTARVIRLHSGPAAGDEVGGFAEFFANPLLPEREATLFRSTHSDPLTGSVLNGDAVETRASLASHRLTNKRLNRELFDAAISDYDNTAVIDLLVKAGADVNARSQDGVTPLMNAVAHPCNLRPLLNRGADMDARDKWGRNALQVARQTKAVVTIQLLEQARGPRSLGSSAEN